MSRRSRSDALNGGAFGASGVVDRLEEGGTGTFRIAPDKPWQHRLGESFNSRLRGKCLNEHEFWSLKHARVQLELLRIGCNTGHLHSSLDCLTSEEYAAAHPAGAARERYATMPDHRRR